MRARFDPRNLSECRVCHVPKPPEKLGVCHECGGQFCGDHILQHPCPPVLEVAT